MPLSAETDVTQLLRDRRIVHLVDIEHNPAATPQNIENARLGGYRTRLMVPMLRGDSALGLIAVTHQAPIPFSDQQVALLQTFADQAVIAIENVRLFKELEARNRDLTEALEQQTATSEILRAISSNPSHLQPVLDTIAENSARVCGAHDATVHLLDAGRLRHAAHYGPVPVIVAGLDMPLSRNLVGGRAVLERRPIQVDDLSRAEDFPEGREFALQIGFKSTLAVPLLREHAAIGVVTIRRLEAHPFSDQQVALLQTFADQAVIAIENVRLFKELEARNRDLTEALEQQTATAEVLRVISRSQTDVQPVFDTIVRSAVRLCDGLFGALYRFDGELLHHVAQHNYSPEALEEVHRIYPMRPTRGSGGTRAILERAVVHIPDIEADSEFQIRGLSHAIGARSSLFVPMLREGAPIGVIGVARAEPGPFSDTQVELLKTFADQAVIAVENVRLFKELQARTGELTQSVEKLTALGEVSRAVSSTLDVETVLDTIVSRASQLAGGAGCSIFEYDAAAEQFELRATHNDDTEFVSALRAVPLRKGEGLMGRAAEMREPIQIPDITQPGAYESSVRDTLIRFGYRALLAVPLLREDQIIGSLSFNRKAPGEFPPEVIDVLKTFATQSALAIQNARLFREIADKSAQLEAASRHKSEFLANMSHELRTPLNAIIGFSEVLSEGMFGEINEKQTEYLQDILESGRHLLSLINDILDLSKIEAGRMELELSDFHLPSAIENALILVRERASRRGIRLGSTIDERLGAVGGDERKVKQVLLNLLSNALKFTPEGGRIDVGARLHDHVAEVSVADTGIGIAPADQEAVFEEFRQVGAADKKAEGTGLGLALSRKFIELHGGRIWVKSELGTGSTFTFTLPVGRGE
jgi:signal transduction histidine kinase